MVISIGLENVGKMGFEIICDIIEQIKKNDYDIFVIPEHPFFGGLHENALEKLKPFQLFISGQTAVVLNTKTVEILEFKKEHNYIYTKLKVENKVFGVFGAYIQHSQNRMHEELLHLMKFVEKNYSEHCHHFIVGDLNTNLIYSFGKPGYYGAQTRAKERAFLQIMNTFNMIQYNDIPNEYGNQIDVILGTVSFNNVKCQVANSIINKNTRFHLPYQFKWVKNLDLIKNMLFKN